MNIKRINTDRDFLEWDELLYDYWDVFDQPQDIALHEIILARKYLNMMNLELDEQYIISFRATPIHFAHMIVNFIRHIKSENPEFFTGNFLNDIDDDL